MDGWRLMRLGQQLGLFDRPVSVRGYVKHDGTVVRPHTRVVPTGTSLHEHFGEGGAPKPGERGHVPEPYGGRDRAEVAATMLSICQGLIEDPDFAMMLQVHPDDADGEWHQGDAADLAGIPGIGHNGRDLSERERIALLGDAVELALATHPERGWGSGVYHDEQEASGRLPDWVARAILQDALRPGKLRLVNVDKETAADFIAEHHSELPYLNPRGLMYAVGAEQDGRLVAVATAGAPSGRWSHPHGVLEVTRVASDGTVLGAASKLVARLLDLLPSSVRDTDAPARFVTYQLVTERGTIYRALREKGLRPTAYIPGKARGGGGSRGSGEVALASVDKIRWEAGPAAAPADWSLLERLRPE